MLCTLVGVIAYIYASKESDPGTVDVFGDFRSKMLATGAEPMECVKADFSNSGGIKLRMCM